MIERRSNSRKDQGSPLYLYLQPRIVWNSAPHAKSPATVAFSSNTAIL